MNRINVCGVFLLLGASLFMPASAGPLADDDIAVVASHIDNSVHTHERTHVEEALIDKLNGKCSHNDVSSCVMVKLITSLNRMLKKASIEIGDDIEVTQTASEEEVEDMSSRSFESGDESEEGQFSELIADKLWTFVRTRSLKWKIMDSVDLLMSSKSDKEGNINLGFSFRDNSVAEKGRGKKNNNMGALIAAAVLKIGILKALAFKALVMLVGKALIVSKMALVLAAVIGLKKLFSQEKHVTYEVVAHPHHSHEHSISGGGGGGHDSYSSGWGRSLAYKAHAPTN